MFAERYCQPHLGVPTYLHRSTEILPPACHTHTGRKSRARGRSSIAAARDSIKGWTSLLYCAHAIRHRRSYSNQASRNCSRAINGFHQHAQMGPRSAIPCQSGKLYCTPRALHCSQSLRRWVTQIARSEKRPSSLRVVLKNLHRKVYG